MKKKKKYYQYELQRRNSIMNYVNSIGNTGFVTAPVPGVFDTDYQDSVDDLTQRETIVKFSDGGIERYDWTGTVTYQNMVDAGLLEFDPEGGKPPVWKREITSIQFGTGVTELRVGACVGS